MPVLLRARSPIPNRFQNLRSSTKRIRRPGLHPPDDSVLIEGKLFSQHIDPPATVFSAAVFTAKAQDPVQVDPQHHKVELENAQVRVLRITIGPHEKTAMHEHPAWVSVFLTEGHVKVTFPDGKTEGRHSKAGEAQWHAGEKHVVENVSDKPLETVMVELKGKAAKAKPAVKKKS